MTTHHHNRGYTMIEMLMVVAIIGIIVPVLYGSIVSLYRNQGKTIARALALSEATQGVQDIVRDVRAAVYGENGALPIVSIATSSLTLFADTDFDGRVERVRYVLNGTTMQKGVVEPTATSSYVLSTEVVETLASNITNGQTATPVFRYYSATSTEITSSASILNVRRVTVELVAEARFSGNVTQVTLRSAAAIRNLKDAY